MSNTYEWEWESLDLALRCEFEREYEKLPEYLQESIFLMISDMGRTDVNASLERELSCCSLRALKESSGKTYKAITEEFSEEYKKEYGSLDENIVKTSINHGIKNDERRLEEFSRIFDVPVRCIQNGFLIRHDDLKKPVKERVVWLCEPMETKETRSELYNRMPYIQRFRVNELLIKINRFAREKNRE